MIYRKFKDVELSALGFGAMRLPLNENGGIDVPKTREMFDYAISHGVNYFDTAVPYHDGTSEAVVGEILSSYPKDKWFVASKYPGHQHFSRFCPDVTFPQQLDRLRIDHFDFYLMHNICEDSLPDYMNSRWKILDYFAKCKSDGLIRYFGISSHASPSVLSEILDGPYGELVDFCQIQLNYVDWTMQNAKEKVRILNERGIPIWVMEPVRGGFLSSFSPDIEEKMHSMRPSETVSAWAFRWLQSIEGVCVTLSGMSSLAQMIDNVNTFAVNNPLNDGEKQFVHDVASSLKKFVPCTACRYCCESCSAQLDIPQLIRTFNDLSLQYSLAPMMYLESLPPEKRPSSCLSCGECVHVCPQGINVPSVLLQLNDFFENNTKWSEICTRRNAIIED